MQNFTNKPSSSIHTTTSHNPLSNMIYIQWGKKPFNYLSPFSLFQNTVSHHTRHEFDLVPDSWIPDQFDVVCVCVCVCVCV